MAVFFLIWHSLDLKWISYLFSRNLFKNSRLIFNLKTNKTFSNRIAENEFEKELSSKKNHIESMSLMSIWLTKFYFKLML